MRNKILTVIALYMIVFGSFSSLRMSLVQAQSPSPFHLEHASKFQASNNPFPVAGQMIRRSQLLNRPLAQPTPTATQAIPAIADPTVILTLAGVIGAFIAVVVMLFALRGKGNK